MGTILKIRVDLKYRTGTMLIVDSSSDQRQSSLEIVPDKNKEFDMNSCCYFRTNFRNFGRVDETDRDLREQYDSDRMQTHTFYTGVVQRRTMAC